jgi:hypothetical protein
LQDAGRDLRPDVITPAPDVSYAEDLDTADEEEVAASADSDERVAESPASETSSALESSSDDQAAADESLKDEKQ